MDSNIGELVKAVNLVMAAVGYVRGTGRNTQQNYTYTSDEDLLRAIQPAMVEAGLALIPVAVTAETDVAYQTKSGGAMWRRAGTVAYNLVHTSGAIMPVTVYAEGADTADKAAAKMMTSAYKYALRQVFAVPTGDNAEADHKIGQEALAASAPPPRQTNGASKGKPPASKASNYAVALTDLPTVLASLKAAQSEADLNAAKSDGRVLWNGLTADERVTLQEAIEKAETTLAGMVQPA